VVYFLDRDSVRRDDPTTVAVHDILIRAYDDEVDALALAGQVGILKADVDRYPKLRLTWWSILEEAAKENQLRNLINQALMDPTTAAWQKCLRDVLGAAAVASPTSPQGPLEGSARRTSSLQPNMGDLADLWQPGATLTVRFLDGSARQRDLVETAATEWLEYANLEFEFGDDPAALIRVSFRGPGSWAYLAKTCLGVARDQPTANFGWLTDDTPQAEARPVVLHEFGHILGLQHEHGNPSSTLEWDREKVYASFQRPPNLWTREQVDRQILTIWPPRYFPVHKIFDRASIMMHPLPAEYFVRGPAIGRDKQLSDLDRQFVAALYPHRESTDR